MMYLKLLEIVIKNKIKLPFLFIGTDMQCMLFDHFFQREISILMGLFTRGKKKPSAMRRRKAKDRANFTVILYC